MGLTNLVGLRVAILAVETAIKSQGDNSLDQLPVLEHVRCDVLLILRSEQDLIP